MAAAILGVPEHVDLLSVEVWGRFFGEFSGKDKFARLLSYGGRAAGHFGGTAGWAVLASKLSKDVSLHRKTLKLFKWLQDYLKAVAAYRDIGHHPWRRVAATIAAGLYVPYEFCNNMIWLQSVGLMERRANAELKLAAARSRLMVAIALAVRVWFDWKRISPAEPIDPDDARVRSAKVAALSWQTVKVFADLMVYAGKSGILLLCTGWGPSDGVVGLAGVVGSIAGGVPAVVKAAKKLG